MCLLEHWSSFVLQGFMGSIEEGLNRIVEAITPRGLGGHGPRKVKVSNNNIIIININFNNNSKFWWLKVGIWCRNPVWMEIYEMTHNYSELRMRMWGSSHFHEILHVDTILKVMLRDKSAIFSDRLRNINEFLFKKTKHFSLFLDL